MGELRSKGVSETCPLCRAPLPPGPEKLYQLAVQVRAKISVAVDPSDDGTWAPSSTAPRAAMPLRLDIKRKLSSRSDRVKSVDIHPVEPWVLSAMYNGHVFLWYYNTQSLVTSFEVSDQPVRAGKFVTRKQWIVAGSDDMQVRVYNYNTLEKIKASSPTRCRGTCAAHVWWAAHRLGGAGGATGSFSSARLAITSFASSTSSQESRVVDPIT